MKKNSNSNYYGFKISFKYRYGKDVVYCNSFTKDDWFLYPLKDDGTKICCISRTNVISVEEFTSDKNQPVKLHKI